MHGETQRDWYFIAEQPAPAPHLARPEGRAALTHMCELLCSVSAALASFFRMDLISTSYVEAGTSHLAELYGWARLRMDGPASERGL